MHRCLVQCGPTPGAQGTGHSINPVSYLSAVTLKIFAVGQMRTTSHLPNKECGGNLIKILIRIKS